ncbi:MAG: hypothetical protein CVV53_04680 [Spirochaetae bacterium HGW-Spirochaetae-9]|nr:MAG: hypothetical protein CVV53_04680 [Spirochaetae bacterium HGW-Spirochaetae-9]
MSAPALRLRVALDGSGDYRTIGEALVSLPTDDITAGSAVPAVIISIAEGIYREKISVMRPHVTFAGEGRDAKIISWDDNAIRSLPSGDPMGTFNTATLYIGAEDFCARNLRVENSAGDSRIAGQAVACYIDADRVAFIDCGITARQDTLCMGPLPTNPVPKGLNPVHPVRIAGEGDGARELTAISRPPPPCLARNSDLCSSAAGSKATWPQAARIWVDHGEAQPRRLLSIASWALT